MMRFQTTSEYAIRILVYLGIHDADIISAKRLHEELNIPYKYLTRLMSRMERSGLLRSTRGKHGGFRLKKEQSAIYLHEVLNCIEGLDDLDRCMMGIDKCSIGGHCALHNYMISLKKKMKAQICSLTLEELIKLKPGKL